MESKIKNYLENVEGFMDYTRKRTRTASEVDDNTAETNRPNSAVSGSPNTTKHIFNDTLEKLVMFGDYCMDSISNARKEDKGKELVVSRNQITPNHSSDPRMTEFDNPGAYTRQSKVDDWSEAELDALWIAVRKYGEGNWSAMLEDMSMPLLKDKTLEELATRWKEEASKIFPAAEPLPINTVFSNGTTTMPFPSPGTASPASGFSFLKLLAKVENESLKKKNSDMIKRLNQREMMNMGRQEIVATIATNDEAVVQPKLLLCGHFELPIVRMKKSAGNNDAGSSMENPIEIDD
ncbi:uncharacterized protein LOC127132405 [Lathyrus oleraceus]|nr:uncharacterized protein LOC127132405 [Pisum sativum]XP_050917407.1 uncharacterized protein LOC127132405 [Pisum sativum]